MSKKIIAVLCALTLMLTVSAGAVGTGAKSGEKAAAAAENSETISEIKTLLAQVRENSLQLRLLSTKNSDLRQECREKIRAIKDGSGTVSEDTLSQLKELLDKTQTVYGQLAETTGDVREQMLEYRLNKMDKDYDSMLSNLQSVLQVQETRMELKTQLNDLLQQMADLLG